MVGWAIVGVATQFPGWWETVLYSVSGAVTLVMVFVIQHTQARQITAIQRKLDEVVRSAPLADDALIAIEVAADAEFRAIVDRVEGRERVADPLEEASQDDANPDAPST